MKLIITDRELFDRSIKRAVIWRDLARQHAAQLRTAEANFARALMRWWAHYAINAQSTGEGK